MSNTCTLYLKSLKPVTFQNPDNNTDLNKMKLKDIVGAVAVEEKLVFYACSISHILLKNSNEEIEDDRPLSKGTNLQIMS